ncbi:DUF1624 domain-containing protein [Candidatus Micrarchaeota archaeon]|nr:DUF1624 domain-containing protein [Candidatus Micrarchaeota archaeon]
MERIGEVDAIRGIAIILMIVYHFFFDLDYLGIADIPLQDIGWVLFQRVTASLFLVLAGISIVLSEKRHHSYPRHAKRAFFLGMIALLITAATWIFPHEGFIKFGIIHMIALSTLIAPLFLRFGWLNAVLGIMIIAAGMQVHYTDIGYLFWLGPITTDYFALDHYPLVPWFGLILIGTYIGQKIEFKNRKRGWLETIGKNSLLVYLLHQPVIYLLLDCLRL